MAPCRLEAHARLNPRCRPSAMIRKSSRKAIFNAKQASYAKAMKGFGTDGKALISVLSRLDPLQMAATLYRYLCLDPLSPPIQGYQI